jgi:hypothetical protein
MGKSPENPGSMKDAMFVYTPTLHIDTNILLFKPHEKR